MAHHGNRSYRSAIKGLTIPVAILYNTDTTGGNSGSPVLNAKGQLIRVNFDRAWEATINDYAWKSYSRSIAVDIRYVLWVTQKFDGADYLLNEMNIPCASIKSPTLNGLKSNNSTPQDDHNRKKIKQYFFAS